MSSEEEIIETLIEEAAKKILLNKDVEDDDAVDEILDGISENLILVMEGRQGLRGAVLISPVSSINILTELSEGKFWEMLRVNREEFLMLINLIKDDEVFNKAHSCKQFSIELQLAITLFRLGSSGESTAFKKVATTFGVGDGGTVSKITERIFNVFLRLQSKYICWPNKTERSKIVSNTFDELPFCIGYIDATEILLGEWSPQNHASLSSKKHIHSIKAQIVCDHNQLIRHVVIGHPGRWRDAQVYRNSSLFKRTEKYFSSQQWIAGDSAYPLCETLITPYRSTATQLDKNAQIAFNLRHNKYRVRVEHCLGHLKERFGSLKQLRLRVGNKKNHKLCCDWFLVCCILHNILTSHSSTTFQTEIDPATSVEEIPENSISSNNAAEIKRQAIYSLMFH